VGSQCSSWWLNIFVTFTPRHLCCQSTLSAQHCMLHTKTQTQCIERIERLEHLQRGPPIAENKSTTHRTHRTHRTQMRTHIPVGAGSDSDSDHLIHVSCNSQKAATEPTGARQKRVLTRLSSSDATTKSTCVTATKPSSRCQFCKGPDMERARSTWRAGRVFDIVPGKLCFAAFASHVEAVQRQKEMSQTHFITSSCIQSYEPMAEDFGPLNLGCTHEFMHFLGQHFNGSLRKGQRLLYYTVSFLHQP
jgi:hypothetical protein